MNTFLHHLLGAARRLPSVLTIAVVVSPPGLLQAGAANAEERVSLEQFVVSTTKDASYSATSALGVNRMNTPLIEVPQFVNVINREFLRDNAGAELYDSLKYLSGISFPSNVGDTVMIRGFLVRSQYTDGLPDLQTQSQMGAEPFLFEQLELLRGPSAIIYGSHNPGGVLNRVRKTPQWEQGGELGVMVGNHGQFKVELDATGPLSDTFAYRAVATFRDEDLVNGSAVRHAYGRRWTFAPMLTWCPVPKVQVRFLGEALHEEHFKHWGENAMLQPFVAGGRTTFGLLPRDFTFSDEVGRNDNDKQLLWLSLETRLTDYWSMRLAGNAIWWDHWVLDMLPSGIRPDNQTMPRAWRIISNDDFVFSSALDNLFEFNLGPTRHNLLVIAQSQKNRGYSTQVQDRNSPTLDIFDPVYGYRGPVNGFQSRDNVVRSSSWNVAAQDHIKLLDERIQLVGGVRHDAYRTRTDNFLTGVQGVENHGSATTFKFGIVYRPLRTLSLYYNNSETFTAVFGANPDGTNFKPQEGVINELGAKTAFFSGRLNATLALFDLELLNLLRPDPDPARASAGWRFQDLKQTTKGADLDLAFSVTSRWELMAGLSQYSYDRPSGGVPEGASKHTVSFWTRYAFSEGRFRNLAIGGGWSWKSRSPIEDSNLVFGDAYGTVDGFASYVWKNYRLSLNISNLADKWYLQRAVNRNILYAGPDRLIRFRVGYEF